MPHNSKRFSVFGRANASNFFQKPTSMAISIFWREIVCWWKNLQANRCLTVCSRSPQPRVERTKQHLRVDILSTWPNILRYKETVWALKHQTFNFLNTSKFLSTYLVFTICASICGGESWRTGQHRMIAGIPKSNKSKLFLLSFDWSYKLNSYQQLNSGFRIQDLEFRIQD